MREPKLQVCSGMVGVGKTHQSAKELDAFITGSEKLKRAPRAVLAFDPNNRDYKHYDTLYYDVTKQNPIERTKYIRLFAAHKRAEGMRILALRPNGQPFTIEDKLQCFQDILDYYSNGVIMLEDMNNYVTNFDSNFFVSKITTYRHRNTDLFVHLQSVAALRPRLWQACKVLRMHKDLDDVSRIKERLGSERYKLVKISSLIVAKQFEKHEQVNSITYPGKSEAELEQIRRYFKSFFVYADMERHKLFGSFSKEDYVTACKTFLNENRKDQLGRLIYEITAKPKESDWAKASDMWVEQNMKMMGI